MSTLLDIYNTIDQMAPFVTQLDWDNSGLQWGDWNAPVTRVLLALDLTLAVLEEADALGAGLIITHHPAFFTPVKRLCGEDLAYKAIRKGIGVIAAHTNWDAAAKGVNEVLAERLGLQGRTPLEAERRIPYRKIVVFVPKDAAGAVYDAMAKAGAGQYEHYAGCAFMSAGTGTFTPLEGSHPAIGQPGKREDVAEIKLEMVVAPAHVEGVVAAMKAAHPYEVPGYDIFQNEAIAQTVSIGFVGELPTPHTAEGLAAFVKTALGCDGLRYIPTDKPIRRVAVCGGSGGDTLEAAIALGADALVTGDVKHSVMLQAAEKGICLVDAGHYATEQPAMPALQKELAALLPEVTFCLSQRETPPARFL